MTHDILIIGAHPDDCELSCGGTAAKWRARGDRVTFVSVTNGNKGHFADEYRNDPTRLAARRRHEGQAAAQVIGASWETFDVPDGELYVTPELTERMVRLIRTTGPAGRGPDLVVTNRPDDYHRDHRHTSRLVLDATYLLTVPLFCPETPHLARMPVFAYWYDRFTEGTPFRTDVVVVIDEVFELKVAMAEAHGSQVYEWLPYNAGILEEVPTDAGPRRDWLAGRLRQRNSRVMEACRKQGRGSVAGKLAEAFQISEYGKQPSPEEMGNLFPV